MQDAGASAATARPCSENTTPATERFLVQY